MKTPELPTPDEIGKLFAKSREINTDSLFSAMLKMTHNTGTIGGYTVHVMASWTPAQKQTVEQMLEYRGWKIDRLYTVSGETGTFMHISPEVTPDEKPPRENPKKHNEKQRPYTVSGRAAACAKARHEAGWTIREVCELAGVSKHAYWGMETGETRNPRTETRISVAKALDIDPKLFLGRRK